MKSLLIRAFALSLVATGVVASAQIAQNHSSIVKIGTTISASPVPVCPPDDPNGCGIGQMGN